MTKHDMENKIGEIVQKFYDKLVVCLNGDKAKTIKDNCIKQIYELLKSQETNDD